MTERTLIALLAGARETQAAAEWLAQTPASGVVIWAEGSERVDLDLPERDAVPGDAVGILDVTHAFDTRTRERAVAAAPGATYARISRDPWQAEAGDQWAEADTIEEAVHALPSGARVFAATGRASLPALARHDGPVFLRQLNRHDQPTGYPNCTYVFGVAPFDPEGEAHLLTQLKIDVVLARNIGGAGSFPKLAAARKLGLPVVLLRPPAVPVGAQLRNAADVLAWVRSL
ncbi:precorrin-6A/cobalt-precorrin-6A reductase [uncultured Tateyamaria sp.]|uniref:precorrin-6A/cobalt-precorrin-6A reductase n=1 Tax=uncultured Tateyamaria sp. TaxID=455651 RepID=UPI00260736C6|nr:precorrin-6A/cobalt-precorrin-6A reductase [uncultured Tateyamaria sp.]